MRRDRFFRLTLARDLAVRGLRYFDGPRHGAEAIQAVVLVDLAIEVATRTAIECLGRTTADDRFKDLMDTLPELNPHREDLRSLHEVRNSAQHRGVVPPDGILPILRSTAGTVLRAVFALAGTDFDTFNSVGQIQSEYFKAPLLLALSYVHDRSTDAAALASRVLSRFHGWAAHLTGNALIPDEMWVFDSGLWGDIVMMRKCLDNREEFVKAMLYVSAGASMGIDVPTLTRFLNLASGHAANETGAGFDFEHDDNAATLDPKDAAWMIEIVARSVVRLEEEWPDLLLVEQEDKGAESSAEAAPPDSPAMERDSLEGNDDSSEET